MLRLHGILDFENHLQQFNAMYTINTNKGDGKAESLNLPRSKLLLREPVAAPLVQVSDNWGALRFAVLQRSSCTILGVITLMTLSST